MGSNTLVSRFHKITTGPFVNYEPCDQMMASILGLIAHSSKMLMVCLCEDSEKGFEAESFYYVKYGSLIIKSKVSQIISIMKT